MLDLERTLTCIVEYMELTIKEFADKTGISLHTLRYYEKIGLFDPVPRAANGHRRYQLADFKRAEFLKRLRKTGMSVQDMQYYVDLFRRGDPTLAERLTILEDHYAVIQAHIQELQDTLTFLDAKIETYHTQLQMQDPHKQEEQNT